jgi:tetratricopeptide (TPR) repeat protein
MAWLGRLIASADLDSGAETSGGGINGAGISGGGISTVERAGVLLQMGHLAYWLTDFDRGERLLSEARELLAGPDSDPVLLGRVLRRLGAIAAARDDVVTARVRLEESLAVLEHSAAPTEAAISKLHLGSLLADESHTDAALPLLAAARDALRAAGDGVQEAHALSALSLAWWKAGDLSAALGAAEQAVTRFAALGQRPSEGVVSYRLAAICRALGLAEQSQSYAERALVAGDETGTRTTSALAHLGLARLDLDRADLAAATAQLTAALEMIDTAADRWVLAESLEVLGRLLIERDVAVDGQAVSSSSGTSTSRVLKVAAELRELIGQPTPPAEAAELTALAVRAGRLGRSAAPKPTDASAVRGWALDLCWSTPPGGAPVAKVSQPG